MREILFRGKSVSNNEWVEGSYVHRTQFYGEDCPCDDHFILSGGEFHCDYYNAHEIIPETLGQFTGLTDKNGKRIFEGDIVRVKGAEGDENWKDYDEIGKVVFVDGAFLIEVPKEYNGMKYYSKIHSYYMTIADWVTREVVGNRFDNAELLTAERSDNEN